MTNALSELNHHADWQWNVNAWGKQDNPSTAVNYYLVSLDGPTENKGMGRRAIKWLRYGQRHNAAALLAYERVLEEEGADVLFWAVMCGAGARADDVDAATVHLEWQAHSDPLSLVHAAAAWAAAAGADAVQARRLRIRGAFSLLCGQAHNHNAAQLYRACLLRAEAEFAKAIAGMTQRLLRDELVHPYLQGAEPSAVSIRDEVPREEPPGDR